MLAAAMRCHAHRRRRCRGDCGDRSCARPTGHSHGIHAWLLARVQKRRRGVLAVGCSAVRAGPTCCWFCCPTRSTEHRQHPRAAFPPGRVTVCRHRARCRCALVRGATPAPQHAADLGLYAWLVPTPPRCRGGLRACAPSRGTGTRCPWARAACARTLSARLGCATASRQSPRKRPAAARQRNGAKMTLRRRPPQRAASAPVLRVVLLLRQPRAQFNRARRPPS